MTKRKKLGAILLGAILALGVGAGIGAGRVETGKAEGPTTVTVTRDDFTGGTGYAEGTWSKGGISGKGYIYFTTTANIQVSTNAGRRPFPYNETATSRPITNISVTMPGTGSLRDLTPRVSASSAVTTETSGTALTKKTFTSNTETLSWDIAAADDIRYFQLVPSGNTNWASFTFTYAGEDGGGDPDPSKVLTMVEITTQPTKKTYNEGDAFDPTGIVVEAEFDDGASYENVTSSVVYEPSVMTVGTTQVKASYTHDGVTMFDWITGITVNAVERATFTQVEPADDLKVGATYTIGTATGDPRRVIKGLNTGGKYYDYTTITPTLNQIRDDGNVLIFELENGTAMGSYAFKILNTSDAGKYITYSGSSNELYATTLATITAAGSWTYTASGIENVGINGRFIRYNNSSPRFAAYTSAQTAVSLFVDESTIPYEPEFETTTRIEVASDFAKTIFFTHETFTTAGLIIIAHDDNNGVSKNVTLGFTTNLDGKVFASSDVADGVTVTVTYDGVDGDYLIDVKEARSFIKVTSQSQIKADGLYIATGIDPDDGLVALGKIEGTNRNAVSIIEIDEKLFENDTVQILKLHNGHESVDDSFAFESVGGPKDGKFLAATGSGTSNNMSSQDTVTVKGSWIITVGESTTIEAIGAGYERNKMRYNDFNNIFSAYGSGQTDITLYALEEDPTPDPDVLAVDAFVTNNMHPEILSTDVGTGECISEGYYAAAKVAFHALTADQRALFVSDDAYEAPRARLAAWAIANGDVLNTSTNMLETPVSPAQNALINGLNDSNTIMLIVIISLISVSVLGGAFYLRKREQN